MALPNTHHGPKEIAEILKNKKKIFFDGIGGVSMNSLAHISHLRGYEVSGYDRTLSLFPKAILNIHTLSTTESRLSHAQTTSVTS